MGDRTIVVALRRGDPEGLAAAYRTYADRLFTYCRSMLRDGDAAADVVHDTFVIASARAGDLRDPDRFRAWLYAIARNECLRQLGSRRRSAPLEAAGEVTADSVDPDLAIHAEQVRELVWAAADGLNSGDREVIELAVRHGLSAVDIGAALGVPANHAHARLSRARGQLERALGALLVARAGSRDCEVLAGLLEGWNGRLTGLLRKRVNRHIETCPVCAAVQREQLSPAALLAAYATLPFLAVGAELWTRIKLTCGLGTMRGSEALGAADLGSSGMGSSGLGGDQYDLGYEAGGAGLDAPSSAYHGSPDLGYEAGGRGMEAAGGHGGGGEPDLGYEAGGGGLDAGGGMVAGPPGGGPGEAIGFGPMTPVAMDIVERAGRFDRNNGFPRPLDARRRGMTGWAAAAAAVIVLLIIGGVVVLPNLGNTTPAAKPAPPIPAPVTSESAEESPSPSESLSPTPTPTPSASTDDQTEPASQPSPSSSTRTVVPPPPPPPPPPPAPAVRISLSENTRCSDGQWFLFPQATVGGGVVQSVTLHWHTRQQKGDSPMTQDGPAWFGSAQGKAGDGQIIYTVSVVMADGRTAETRPRPIDDPCTGGVER